MTPVTLPNMPSVRAQDFQLDGFEPPRFARVIYSPKESMSASATIIVQAFEVDAQGRFVASEAINGAPSRSPSSQPTIAKSGIGDTHTLKPGFVRVVGGYTVSPETAVTGQGPLPDGTSIVESLPATAAEGDLFWCQETLYRWDAGELNRIMRGKAEELAGILRNSEEFAELDL